MEIIKIIFIAVISTVMIIIMNTCNKEQGFMIRIAACILMFLITISKVSIFKEIFNEISNISSSNDIYIGIIFKIIGIAYLIEIASEISKDAGEGAISSNLLLAGKILILYVASPVILIFINLMTSLIN